MADDKDSGKVPISLGPAPNTVDINSAEFVGQFERLMSNFSFLSKDIEDRRRPRSFLSGTFWMAALPVWAYSLAYSYQWGVFVAFGLPSRLISVHPVQVFKGVLTIGVALLAFWAASIYAGRLRKRWRVVVYGLINVSFILLWETLLTSKMGLQAVLMALMGGGVVTVLFQRGEKRDEAVQSAARGVQQAGLSKHWEGLCHWADEWRALREQEKEKEKKSLLWHMLNELQVNPIAVLLLGVMGISLLCAPIAGYKSAASTSRFLVVAKPAQDGVLSNEAVVLDAQVDRIICRGLKKENRGLLFVIPYPDGDKCGLKEVTMPQFDSWYPSLVDNSLKKGG